MARLMALSDNYLTLFVINPETDEYMEFSSTDDYTSLGTSKSGWDFFGQAHRDAAKVLYPADLDMFLSHFSKEQVLNEIHDGKVFSLNYQYFFICS